MRTVANETTLLTCSIGRTECLSPFVNSGDLGEPFRDSGADLLWRVFL